VSGFVDVGWFDGKLVAGFAQQGDAAGRAAGQN